MKANNYNDDNLKATQGKSNKKSAKSRSKSSKSESSQSVPVVLKVPETSPQGQGPVHNSNTYVVTTPTTPTSSLHVHSGNIFDSNTGHQSGSCISSAPDINSSGGSSSGSRSHHHKNYAGFEPRSIKIIWEQHDQSDVELSQEVCTRLAEDASYKLWELINNIKTYARHSGGAITYDLVNDVLRDSDVPPALGAVDSPWDRVDYDGSFYFYSDKIIELRDEYQKEINIEMPLGSDFSRSWLIEDKHLELMRKFIPSLVFVTLQGRKKDFALALQEAAFSPLVAAGFPVLLAKIIQILGYKQTDRISLRCWQLLRACAVNPYVRDVDCRIEYFHLAEILICQLAGPFECIKVHNNNNEQKNKMEEHKVETNNMDIKMENISEQPKQEMPAEQSNVKSEILYTEQQEQQQQQTSAVGADFIFRLQPEEDGTNDADVDLNTSTLSSSATLAVSANTSSSQNSPYFASPVDFKSIDDLCSTLGSLGAISGYFETECLYLILRRLNRFFIGRTVSTDKEYNYIIRVLRGLISLGEYAFREFIPFIFKFDADDIPETLWNDFALSAVFLRGPDDIFLYEWLEYVCGADKLQPYMVYFAEYFEKFQTLRFLQRKQPVFKINPKLGARRLEWSSTIAAAIQCRGDNTKKVGKKHHKMKDLFPDLAIPNLHLNRSGNIRFKFAGCRPVILRPKTKPADSTNSAYSDNSTDSSSLSSNGVGHDIIIAKRKLFKPLSSERRTIPISNYFYCRI